MKPLILFVVLFVTFTFVGYMMNDSWRRSYENGYLVGSKHAVDSIKEAERRQVFDSAEFVRYMIFVNQDSIK